MASAHHPAQHSRYSHPPPPPPANAQNDFRLPSLKDLNFQYRPPPPSQESPSTHTNGGSVEPPSATNEPMPRHNQPWARSNPSPAVPTSMAGHQQHAHHPHQQHTPPLSAGHELASSKVEYSHKVDYSPKHDSAGYLTPGMPLSAQMTPLPGSVNIGPGTRGDEAAHVQSQAKRPRTTSQNMNSPRDIRPSHVSLLSCPLPLEKKNIDAVFGCIRSRRTRPSMHHIPLVNRPHQAHSTK